MTTLASGVLSTPQLWYVTRATAVTAFVLLTLSFGFGLAATQRVRESRWWPRFATQHLHRNLALLAVGFAVAHIVTTLIDSFVRVGWWSLVVPFASPYRTLGVTLGTLAFDAVLLVVVTSLVRDRLPLRAWRAIHWTTYLLWPMAFGHFLVTGTDGAAGHWGIYLAVVSAALLVMATATRWLTAGGNRDLVAAPRPIGVR